MAKLQDNVEQLFSVFATAIANDEVFTTVCNQTAAMLGQLKVETVEGDWKVSAKGILSQANKNKCALPMNNPCSILFATGLELGTVARQRKIDIQASIPELCSAWIGELKKKQLASMQKA